MPRVVSELSIDRNVVPQASEVRAKLDPSRTKRATRMIFACLARWPCAGAMQISFRDFEMRRQFKGILCSVNSVARLESTRRKNYRQFGGVAPLAGDSEQLERGKTVQKPRRIRERAGPKFRRLLPVGSRYWDKPTEQFGECMLTQSVSFVGAQLMQSTP